MTAVATITTCAHPRCQTSINAELLACRTHWYQLPTSLRNRILRSWKRRDRVGHGHAVTEALHHWISTIEEAERPPRCHNCKSEALGIDTTTGLAVCLVCAKGELGGNPVTQVCPGCGHEADLVVSLQTTDEIGPYLCADCHLKAAGQ